jgi:hypothetical protein
MSVTPRPEGLGSRRAALQLLDAVLRRGQTLDAAAQKVATPDRPLALAIAGETLRRLPDLDAAIDGATSQRLPGDAKARNVLRLALAQKVALNVPDHALVATALPLVEGGPRRLVHGVLGTLLRRGLASGAEARLPPEVEARWTEQWCAARRSISASLIRRKQQSSLRSRGASSWRPRTCACMAARASPTCPASVKAAGGFRTSPRRCPLALFRRKHAMCLTYVQRPAARPCSLPRPVTG